jgi:hypothetical protein
VNPQTILFGIVLVFLVPMGLCVYLFKYYQSLREKPEISRLLLFGIATLFYGLYLGLAHLYSVWLVGYFGILSCLYIPALGIATFFVVLVRKNGTVSNGTALTKSAAGIVLFVFILSQILSPLIARQLSVGCDALHRVLARQLVGSMQDYKAAHDVYPGAHALVPNYLAKMPRAFCLVPVDWLNGPEFSPSEYQVEKCDNGMAFIVVRSTFFGSEQTYNLVSREWDGEEDWDDPCDKY